MTASKRGTAEDFFFRVFRNLFAVSDNVLLHRRLNFRRRNIPVLRNSLARCNTRHLRIKRLVQFTFADPVYNNVLKNRAALLCRACGDPPICVAERYLTLRIRGYMSARSASLRKKKSSAVPLFRSGHMSAICARLSQKEVGVKRVETLVSTLLPRRGARRIPALRRAQLLA